MRAGNQIVNGIFEFNESLEYTENDIVIRTYLDSEGNEFRRLYKVNSTVVGVKPELDLSETYFIDYFKSAYSGSDILTKSTVDSYIRSNFAGFNENGIFSPEEISESSVTSINTSGMWYITATEQYVVVYISLPQSFMLLYKSDGSISFRFGDTVEDQSHNISVTWSEIHTVNGRVDDLVSQHITSLNSLEVLLRDRITQYDDLINGLTLD